MQNSMYYTTSGLTSLPAYQGGGYLDQYGRQQYGLGKLVSKITKPISRVLDKIIPNEIKPILPFAAAAMPWLAGAGYLGTGLTGLSRLQSLALGAGSNLFSQLSQEGADKRGINPLSLGLSALSGALAVPGTGGADQIVGNIGAGTSENVAQAIRAGDLPTTISQVPGNYNSVLETIPKATSDLSYLQKAQNSVGNLFDAISKTTAPVEGQDILSIQTAKQLTPPLIGAATESSMRVAQDALDKYNTEQNALGQMGVADQSKRRDAVIHAMQLAGFDQTGIDSALGRLGLAEGGIGYQYGGGAIGYKQGGLMDLKGHEMDFRDGGGFVPLGRKERADDVPARLSKNEFVFTAKAVRNAGDGDIKKGAKKMYQIMKQLEARA